MRSLIRSIALSVCGLSLWAVALWLAELTPGTPVFKAKELVSRAMEGNASSISRDEASSTLGASEYFETSLLPGIVGLCLGLALGTFLQVSTPEAVISGAIVGLGIITVRGGLSVSYLPEVTGVVAYTFLLVTTGRLSQILRRMKKTHE
jgi:hypothetical protein